MQVIIACLQMASLPYDWDYNIKKVKSLIREAAKNGAEICILPEMFIPGYSLVKDNFAHGESIDGKTISALKHLAKELNIYLTGAITEKTLKHFYNTMFFIGPEGLIDIYHKINVYSIENKFWKRGKEGKIIDTKFGKIGLGICADMQFPKPWKQYAGKVNFILICSAWPENAANIKVKFAVHGQQLCKDLPIQISNKLKVPVAFCNASHECVGEAPFVGKMCCQGFSKIVVNGNILSSINSREEKIISCLIDIPDEPPKVDPSVTKNWIDFTLGEKIIKFFVEKTAKHYSQLYYHFKKKKFLKGN